MRYLLKPIKLILISLLCLCILAVLTTWLIISQLQQQPVATNDQQLPLPDSPTIEPEIYHGVSISPQSFSPDDYQQFYPLASEVGNALTWAGNWQQLAEPATVPAGVVSTARKHNLEPIIVIGLANTNPTEQAQLIQATANFAHKHKIKYLAFGVEVNIVARSNQPDYQTFVKLYQQQYTAIKKLSHQTQVFTVFQYEQLLGLQGGLFGGQNDTTKLNQWQLLADFPNSDLLGITSYPFLVYKSPADIPADYYQQLQAKTTKPIAIIELGWTREGPKGWESSSAEQAEFIRKYYELTRQLKPQIEIWSFLFDPDTKQTLFTKTGLLPPDSNESVSYQLWKAEPGR